MSASQAVVVGGAAALAVSAVLGFVLPKAPIVINALSYAEGMVTQDRTVTGKGEVFFMGWSAEVVNMATGDPVPWCIGQGSYNYRTGRRVVEFTLPDWVGNAACLPESLLPGRYQLRAIWRAGDVQVIGNSAEWVIE